MRSVVALAMLVIGSCGARSTGGADAPRSPAEPAAAAAAPAAAPALGGPGGVLPMTGGASLYVDQLAIWDQPVESLSPTARAYLARLERLLRGYASAPRPPATFTSDRARFERWAQAKLVVWAAAYDAETARLVDDHPRSSVESPAEVRFFLLLQIAENHAAARYLTKLVGGPPGYAGCPHDVADDLARVLTELARDAERCAAADGGAPEWQATADECGRRAAWARQLLATAPPPPPDACLEDMPELGD